MTCPPPVEQLIVLTHPDPGSFCSSVAHRWQVRAHAHSQICDLRDLYADQFDPVLKLAEQPGKPGFFPTPENLAELHRLQQLDVLVLVYPLWFGTPPAMLKGYLERVIGSATAFGPRAEGAKPLGNVRLVQIVTSASSKPWLAEKGVRDSLHMIYDRYLVEVFGARETVRLHLNSIVEGMGAHHAATQLAKVDDLADRICAKANSDRWNHARALMGNGAGGAELG